MRRKYVSLLICLSALSSLMLLSCHHENSSATMQIPGKDSAKSAAKDAQMEADQDSETFLLPSPLHIAATFKNAGLSYFPDLTSKGKDASQFNSNFDAAINMGIYTADLAYCVLNKQTQEALDYMKIVKSLSDKLGFGSVFQSNTFMQRFQNNMDNTDSLAHLLGDLQMETDAYLEQNKEKYIGVIVFTGAWAESMFVGSKVYEKGKSSNVSTRISEQMNILDNLVKLLTKYEPADSHIKGLVTDLQSIETQYAAFSEVKNYNPEDTKPISLSPEHIAQISSLVQDLRAKFTAS